MFDYLALSSFKMPTPDGPRFVSKGEVLRLSSIKAAFGVNKGVLIEKNVSGLLNILGTTEARARLLVEKLNISSEVAAARAKNLIDSLTKRHESLHTYSQPTTAFLAEVAEFNRTATGKNPITKIKSETGAGEWAGYNCNIVNGCSHGCLYCYGRSMAKRFKRIDNNDAWLEEKLRDVTTAKCKKYPKPIMFQTTSDITPAIIKPYRCHLYNILKAGNFVISVSKPHRECIEAICTEFSSFRDNLILRFTIGGLDNEALRVWEPGAPALNERLWCLRYAFEQGFKTSLSSEPMLVNCEAAERFYYCVEPLVTEDIWFGKMGGVGGFKEHSDPEVVRRAVELIQVYKDKSILKFVETMTGLPKVEWKDSIKKVINKHAGESRSQLNNIDMENI